MIKQYFILILFLQAWLSSSYAQTDTTSILLKLVNTDGEPIADATVRLQGTRFSSATNSLGTIILPLIQGDSVSVNHVEYNKQVIWVNKESHAPVTIVMISRTGLMDPVLVNTGYQKLPRERATGSFTQVSQERYKELARVNVLDDLQNVANGVSAMPTNVLKMTNPLIVRGINSFKSSLSAPLIILDNFPYEGDINNINPNDVENITILKDAAAASIWGVKAGNGVLVITTKKGRLNQPVKVNFTSNVTITAPSDLDYLQLMSSSEYIGVERMLFDSGYHNRRLDRPNSYAMTPVLNLLALHKDGLVSTSELEEQLKVWGTYDSRDDWKKYMYKPALNQQYNLAVTGGSNKMSWLFSGGFNSARSELDARADRVNLRWDHQYKFTQKLKVNTSVYYTQTRNISGRPAYGQLGTNSGRLAPYTRLADDDGSALPVYTQYRQVYLDTAGRGLLMDWNHYPLTDYQHQMSNIQSADINISASLEYKILKRLTAAVMYRYQDVNREGRQLYDINSFFTRDLINNYTIISPDGSLTYNIPKGAILDLNNYHLNSQYLRGQFSYNKSWQHHDFSLLAGSEVSETKDKSHAERSYGFNPETSSAGVVDVKNQYLVYSTARSANIPNINSFNATNRRLVSFYGNTSYTYHNKYTVTGSMRRDASNLFGVASNKKWKPLWSVGGSWNIHQEAFYKSEWLPFLKLRATYGKQGNIDPTEAAVTTISYLANSIYSGFPTARITNYPNPELTWEEVNMMNIGFDFRTSNQRFKGSIEYYRKTMNNLFGDYNIETTTGLGATTITKNVGRMKGHGLDIELSHVNFTGHLRWITDLIINSYNDKVVSSFRSADNTPSEMVVGGGRPTVEGYPLYGLFTYKWMGLDPLNGNPMGMLDGQASTDYQQLVGSGTHFRDLVFSGSQTPSLFGSLGNSFSWKGFSITPRITYKFGYYFLRESINYNNLFGSGVSAGTADFTKRWQKPGDEKQTVIPSMVYPNNLQRDLLFENSEALVSKGDHIRLQYINCSYNRTAKPGSVIKGWQVAAIINNVGLIWKANKSGLDPDFGASNIPPSRSFALSLNLSL